MYLLGLVSRRCALFEVVCDELKRAVKVLVLQGHKCVLGVLRRGRKKKARERVKPAAAAATATAAAAAAAATCVPIAACTA